MKIWLVPASLFGPGRIMAPARLARERQQLLNRKAKLEAELASIPEELADIDRQISDLNAKEYVMFKATGRD